MNSLFEQMGGKYIKVGDYYVPDLGQFDDEQTAAMERGEISVDLFLFIDNEKKNNLRKQDEYIDFITKIKEGDIKNV